MISNALYSRGAKLRTTKKKTTYLIIQVTKDTLFLTQVNRL